MQITTHGNKASLRLESHEIFFVKPSFLQGFLHYDWAVPPPHPSGSPFLRMYHGCWILKRLSSDERPLGVTLYGVHARGNFRVLSLKAGERFHVSIRNLAGFSGDLRSIHTKIKFSFSYWMLHRHFFSVFEGPGQILLYAASSFEEAEQTEFQPARLVAFEVSKAFRPVAPQPRNLVSRLWNLLFSHEVIWQFEEPGKVIAETCTEFGSEHREGPIRRFLKHLLGFLKI
jgi:uncharacterized protein (AIM24 family)